MQTPFSIPVLDELGFRDDAANTWQELSDGTQTGVAMLRAINDKIVSSANGLYYAGAVSETGTVDSITIDGLAGLPVYSFPADEWYLYIASTTDGAAPAKDWRAVSTYDYETGQFVPGTSFSAIPHTGDWVCVVHKSIYEATLLNGKIGTPTDTDIATDIANVQAVVDATTSNVGAKNATATADDLSDIATTDLHAKLGRTLLRFSPGAFATNVQGVSRTDVLAIFTAMASYFSASGAAYSVQINNQTARTNIEQTLEDLATVFGVDGTNTLTNINNSANATVNAVFQKFAAILGADSANVFNPTIQGVAQTNLDAALYALAQYFATSGAAISSTVNPGGSARATLELILEDFADMLAGGNGIITWPAAAKYGNGVSIAEALAYVSDAVEAVDTTVKTEVAAATNAAGLTPVCLLDKSTITNTTDITAIQVTKVGTWAGECRFYITDGSGSVVWPDTTAPTYLIVGTDILSAVLYELRNSLTFTVAKGYKLYFVSSDAGDTGAGYTLQLNVLRTTIKGV